MKDNNLSRRAFLGSASVLTAFPVISTSGAAFPGYNEIEVAKNTISDTGEALSAYDSGMVGLAKLIAPAYREARDESSDMGLSDVHAFDFDRLEPGSQVRYFHIRPVLKIIEVVDEALAVSLPDYRLVQAYSAAMDVSSIGGILQACRSLGRASTAVEEIDDDDTQEIEREHRTNFALSLLALTVELAFIVIPINFQFAWRTTRYAANQGLYQLRRLPAGNQLQAITMSYVHWIVRDIPESLAKYLTSKENLQVIYDSTIPRLQEVDIEVLGTPTATEFAEDAVEFFVSQSNLSVEEFPEL